MKLQHRQAGMLQCVFYTQHPIAGSNKTMPPRRCKVHTEFRCPDCGFVACHEHRVADEHTNKVSCINCYRKGRTPGQAQTTKPKRTKRRVKTVAQIRKGQAKREIILSQKGSQWQRYRMYHAKRIGRCPKCGKPEAFLVRKGVFLRKRCYGCYLKKKPKRRKKLFRVLRKLFR